MQNIVISLTSAINRRQHITQEFKKHHVDFEFFDALTPDLANLYAERLLINYQDSELTAGELACMMSHVSIWKKMIDEKIPYLAIFEDDVYLGQDAQYLLNSPDWINPEWNIIKIEAFNKKVFLSSKHTSLAPTDRLIAQLKGKNLGTAGYILSLKGAETYLEYVTQNPSRPLDELMFDHFITCRLEPVYQMLPALCIQEMMVNKDDYKLPSALLHDRQSRMLSKRKPGLYKLKREISRLMCQAKETLYAKELIFK